MCVGAGWCWQQEDPCPIHATTHGPLQQPWAMSWHSPNPRLPHPTAPQDPCRHWGLTHRYEGSP